MSHFPLATLISCDQKPCSGDLVLCKIHNYFERISIIRLKKKSGLKKIFIFSRDLLSVNPPCSYHSYIIKVNHFTAKLLNISFKTHSGFLAEGWLVLDLPLSKSCPSSAKI